MVLGEELIFYNSKDADEFLKYIRKYNCNGNKKTINSLIIEMNIRGLIKNFLSLADEMTSEKDNGPSKKSKKDGQELHQEMEHRKFILENFFANHEIGIKIDEGSDWERLNSLTEDDPRTERIQAMSEEEKDFIITQFRILSLLEENDLVKISDEGIYLSGKIDPENASTSYPAENLLNVDEEKFTMYHLSKYVSTSAQSTFLVTLVPEVTFFEDSDNLDTILSKFNVDEESYAQFITNIAIKKMIVDHILTYTKNQKKVSREELIQKMKRFEVKLDPKEVFTFNLHQTFMSEIIDDLRKMGMLQGKDTKIRYAGD